MKYRITKLQYQNLREQFDLEDLDDENPFSGTQSAETSSLIDLLVKKGVLDLDLINVYDNEITIYSFADVFFENYFINNQINFEVTEDDGEIYVNVEGDGEDEDYRLYQRDLVEIFNYIREVSKKTPSINWYIEGEPI